MAVATRRREPVAASFTTINSVNLMNYAGTPKKVCKAQAEENASKSKKKSSDRHPRLHISLKGNLNWKEPCASIFMRIKGI